MRQSPLDLGHAGEVALERVADRALVPAHPHQRAERRQAVVHAQPVVLGQQQDADPLLIGQPHQPLQGEVAGGQVGVHVHDTAHALEGAGRGDGAQAQREHQGERAPSHRPRRRERTSSS